MTDPSTRRDEALLYLLARSSWVSAKQLSNHLGVSTKTVYRLVREINASAKAEVVKSTRGLGYRLDHDTYVRLTHGDTTSGGSLTPVERRKRILKDLLSQAPAGIDMSSLCREYYVSESQLRADAKSLQKTIEPFSLELQQRQYSLFVVGKETGIRSALSSLLQIDHSGTLAIVEDHLEDATQPLDMEFAHSQVSFISDTLGSAVPPPYDINLATHLYVMIARTRMRKPSQEVDASHFPKDLSDPEQQRYWDVAIQVRRNLTKYLGSPVPDAEAEFVFAYISSSRIEGPVPISCIAEDFASQFVRELAEDMSYRMKVNLATQKLVNDLALHVRPMLNRLRYGLLVSNPVLSQISQAYPELLNQVSEATRKLLVSHKLPDISPDEIGYIALYFARELELRATKVRALITCSSGIGTSELLRVKTEKAFPEIEVVDVVSAATIRTALEREVSIDIVITSIGLPFELDAPVVLVDAMLSPQSQDRVRTALRNLS